jgi:thioredoxin 2
MSSMSVIVKCSECGAANRIPTEKIDRTGKCGKCHAPLPPMDPPNADADFYKLRCVECGAKNRVPAARLSAGAKCGKCGKALKTGDLFAPQPMMITDADFDTQVLKSPLPVLMFAWAPWCSTCNAVAPIIDQFASESKGKVRVAKVNVDASPALANRFNIMSVPFLFIFDNGQMRESMPGALQKHELMMKMAPYI